MVRPGPGIDGVWQLAQPTVAKVVAPAEEVQVASGTAGSSAAMKVSTVCSGSASISGFKKLAPQPVTSSSGTNGLVIPISWVKASPMNSIKVANWAFQPNLPGRPSA